MSRYFEVIYPGRLKELKKQLDIISSQYFKLPLNQLDEQVKLIHDFQHEFSKFTNNTYLHLKHDSIKKQVASEEEIKFITPEYFVEYFGKDTPTGKIFASIQKLLKEKKEKDK